VYGRLPGLISHFEAPLLFEELREYGIHTGQLLSFLWLFQGTSVLSPLFPIAAMTYMAYLTARTSSTGLLQKHPCLFVMAFGMACSKISIKLVVCIERLLSFRAVNVLGFKCLAVRI